METATSAPHEGDRKLFWACFISLVATSFGFILRVLTQDQWVKEFGLNETETGQILGAGLWPFAISIVLFSLIVDRIGYGKAMVFALVCHSSSAILQILAKDYDTMYWATFLLALGSGTVEAVINPVVATMFPKEKTKWLNILHAGWPGGLVLGGLITLLLGPEVGWKSKTALLLIPTAVYGVLMLGRRFPVSERVAAGVSYRDMLREVGFVGALIVAFLVVSELSRVFSWPDMLRYVLIGVLTLGYAAFVHSPGRFMFLFLVLLIIPLATTELGVDSWITPLMTPEMKNIGVQAGWVLVYTSLIMMVLRFCAGPIVHKLSPLGLLATCSGIAALGLFTLSKSQGIMILLAATMYGVGKSFFWPTILGVVAERFPRGGAMTLNVIAGVGMLGVGIIGNPLLGNIQDRQLVRDIRAYDDEHKTSLHERFVGSTEKTSLFGNYRSLDRAKVAEAASPEDQAEIANLDGGSKQNALQKVALLPVLMMVCFAALILYFRAIGGYQAIVLKPGGELG